MGSAGSSSGGKDQKPGPFATTVEEDQDELFHFSDTKHTWTVELQDGSETTHTRYNLATIIEVEKHEQVVSAKRLTAHTPTN